MQTIGGLLAGICFAAALGGMIRLLSPGGSSERLLRLLVTLFILTAAAVPLSRAAREISVKTGQPQTDAAVQAVLQNAQTALERCAREVLTRYGCPDAAVRVEAQVRDGEVHARQFDIYGVGTQHAQEIAHEIYTLTGEMPCMHSDAAAPDG